MLKIFYSIMLLMIAVIFSFAAEIKDLKDINTDALTSETQVDPIGADGDHIAVVWWIPSEFWGAIFSQDSSISAADTKSMLKALSGVSLLAIVQADISNFGAFNYYSLDEVKENLKISFTDKSDEIHNITTVENVNADLSILLSIFKPILSAAMGNLGSNMHFFVLNDQTDEENRFLNPYENGKIKFNLKQKNNKVLYTELELPLNSLFIPRKCPNGKDAHISWKYCPWTGERLQD